MKLPRLSLDEWKMVWGFLLLFIVGGLISRIALGKVEEATSYGLLPMIAMLAVLVGQWAQWAFGTKSPAKQDEEEKK